MLKSEWQMAAVGRLQHYPGDFCRVRHADASRARVTQRPEMLNSSVVGSLTENVSFKLPARESLRCRLVRSS